MGDVMQCATCGKEKRTVQWSQSAHQLIFGGFCYRLVPRCQRCETILAKRIERMLKRMTGTTNKSSKS